jgi:hypothetical protein
VRIHRRIDRHCDFPNGDFLTLANALLISTDWLRRSRAAAAHFAIAKAGRNRALYARPVKDQSCPGLARAGAPQAHRILQSNPVKAYVKTKPAEHGPNAACAQPSWIARRRSG